MRYAGPQKVPEAQAGCIVRNFERVKEALMLQAAT
jgi:hypothetical protein